MFRFLACSLLFTCALFTKPHAFKEVWGYLMEGEERFFKADFPVTDIGYFCARLDDEGKIHKIPNYSFLQQKTGKKPKIHCVITADYNRSLMHWCLKKDLETRDALIAQIVEIGKTFDGVQIDFESIRSQEREAFVLFLQQIRKILPKEKSLSIALPARTKLIQDGYDYKAIAEVADKVLIMGYDEHYSGGPPGTIASLDWHKKVYSFAKSQIPKEKLVMLFPFYGRVWQKQKIGRALKYFQMLDLWKEKSSPTVQREEDNTPYFTYKEQIDAVVYFEDLKSLKTKLSWYEKEGLSSVGFWRISQEPSSLWEHLSVFEPPHN